MVPERRQKINEAIRQLADGNRSAMPALVTELWPVLVAFAQRGLQHAPDAEDVAQEVLLKICSRISEFDAERDGLSWAFGIAAFEMMTQRKRRARRQEASSADALVETSDGSASAEQQLIEAELLLALEEAMGQLTAADLDVLGLGGSVAGAPASAAFRKRRQRALERLRIVWKRLYGES